MHIGDEMELQEIIDIQYDQIEGQKRKSAAR